MPLFYENNVVLVWTDRKRQEYWQWLKMGLYTT